MILLPSCDLRSIYVDMSFMYLAHALALRSATSTPSCKWHITLSMSSALSSKSKQLLNCIHVGDVFANYIHDLLMEFNPRNIA